MTSKIIGAFLIVVLPTLAFAGAEEYTAAANTCLQREGVYIAPGSSSGSGCYARPNGGKMHCTAKDSKFYAAVRKCDTVAQAAAAK